MNTAREGGGFTIKLVPWIEIQRYSMVGISTKEGGAGSKYRNCSKGVRNGTE